MAIIKSYTDLEQSKKLAKILPCETADMTYCAITEGMREKMLIKDWQVNIGLDIAIKENLFSYRNGYMFPCWSLAALFSVLPKEIEIDGQHYAPCLFSVQDKWLLKLWYNSNNIITSPISIFNDNAIDACYEMIQKLHEQNLL